MTENELYSAWWLPFNASTYGAPIDQLIVIIHLFMGLLFVGWGIFFVYCLIRFRARPNVPASSDVHHFKIPTYLEVGIAIIEIVLLVFLSYPIWKKVRTEFPSEAQSLVIRIVAQQFEWQIHYPGRDGKFGRTDVKIMEGTNPLGLDRSDPDAKDDITSTNLLHIPVNKPVIAHLSSKDVIHSLYLPVLRVKQDVIPGMTIPVWFQATQSGEFDIACAQLCGLGHFRMKGTLNIDTPEQYDAWMAEEEKILREQSAGG